MNIPNLEVCMYVCIIVVLYKTSLEFLGSLLISTYGVLFTNIVHHLRRNKKKKKNSSQRVTIFVEKIQMIILTHE